MRKADHLTLEVRKGSASACLSRGSNGATGRVLHAHLPPTRHADPQFRGGLDTQNDGSLSGVRPSWVTTCPKELGEGLFVVRGRLTMLDERAFQWDPLRIMEALSYAHRGGFDLDIFTQDEIKISMPLVDDSFRKSARVRKAFLSVLDTPHCGYEGRSSCTAWDCFRPSPRSSTAYASRSSTTPSVHTQRMSTAAGMRICAMTPSTP